MSKAQRLGYLIPEFPGQTHTFFWREINELERLGENVVVISTRKPKRGLICHPWSEVAMARTTYLSAMKLVFLGAALAGIARDPERASDIAKRGRETILDPFQSKIGAELIRKLIAETAGPA